MLKFGIPALVIGFLMLSGGNGESALICGMPGLLLTGAAIAILFANASRKAEIESQISAKWSEIRSLEETLRS